MCWVCDIDAGDEGLFSTLANSLMNELSRFFFGLKWVQTLLIIAFSRFFVGGSRGCCTYVHTHSYGEVDMLWLCMALNASPLHKFNENSQFNRDNIKRGLRGFGFNSTICCVYIKLHRNIAE